MGYLVVFLGGGVGAALRHGVNSAAARLLGTHFPFGTLTVNVVGSLVMGLMAAWFAFEGSPSQHWRLFLTTGMLGGFTTFSTFSLDTALLYERGELGLGGALCGGVGRRRPGRPVRRPGAGAQFCVRRRLIPSAACRACPATPCRGRGRDWAW